MADDCFIDTCTASEIGCLIEELDKVKQVHDLDGRLMAVVNHITGPVKLKILGNHVTHSRFYLMQSQAIPVILDLPWRKTHNPVISWDCPGIENVSLFCYAHCLRSAVWPPESNCLDGVSSCYHDLRQVFSKDCAQSLPQHRPYDCAIDLQVDAPLPILGSRPN